MAEIKKTTNFGLGLPEHFDPSVDKMSENMNIIDSALFKSIPSKVSADLNFNTAVATGTYLIAGNATGTPSSTTSYNYALTVFATNSTHVYQIARGMGGYTMFFRYKNGSTSFSSWNKIWNAGNDGSDTGLDADTLDGLQGSRYIQNYGKSYTNFNSLTTNGFYQVSNASNSPDGTSGGLWGCIVFQTDGTYGTNGYSCQLAIRDSTTGKQLYVRKQNGSSTFTAWEKIWTSGTDGTGSGLDADLLDGSHATDFVKVADFGDFDYVVSSQAKFNTLIGSSTWLGARSVVFLCDVDAQSRTVTLPSTVQQIEGLNHSIKNCCDFGYNSLPALVDRSRMYIRNLHFYSSDDVPSESPSGIHNCVNLYNITYKMNASAGSNVHNTTLAVFDCCENLINCYGSFEYLSGDTTDKHLTVYSSCTELTNCYGSTACFDLSTASTCVVFNGCTLLKKCHAVIDHTLGVTLDTTRYMYNMCNTLTQCDIVLDRSTSSCKISLGFMFCFNLFKCDAGEDIYGSGGYGFSFCFSVIACEGSMNTDCDTVIDSLHNLMYTTHGGDETSPLEMYTLPSGGYTIVSGYVKYFSDGSSVQCKIPQTFIWDKENGILTVITQQDIHRYSLNTTTFKKTSELTFDVDTNAHLLSKIKSVDGVGSGLDADLLDSMHWYGYTAAGTVSGSLLTTSRPTSQSSCISQMYRFYDTGNIIGEGSNKYYGIIQVYAGSTSYMRVAVSFSSGKMYRQTNGAGSWSEITPLIPVLTADPSSPSNGQMWIRSDLQ